jgi:hypothetical protein
VDYRVSHVVVRTDVGKRLTTSEWEWAGSALKNGRIPVTQV